MRTYGTCMHHVHSCIYIFAFLPYLYLLTTSIKFLLTYDILSQELHTLLQMVVLGAPPHSDTFLAVFGTPTLLWRVLDSVGYAEPPCYFWREVVAEGQPWYDVRMTILAHADNPPW